MEGQAEYSNIRTASPPLRVLLDERVLDVPDHLLDLLPVGVYVCDRAGLIVRYNRAAAELWGCSPKVGDPTVREEAAQLLAAIVQSSDDASAVNRSRTAEPPKRSGPKLSMGRTCQSLRAL